MSLSGNNKDIFSRRYDAIAIGIFFFYCLAFAVSRLLISPTMELDEAEQFLNGSFFQWGYNSQPPLYSWIVRITAYISGLNIFTLIFVKYGLLFLFYTVFYMTARSLWNARKSLIVTGSLMLFPIYAYEFNRDLSHSILVTLMASLTCLLYMRMLMERKVFDYILIGFFIALGILSKYNFLLFLIALGTASLSTREGRRIVFDKRSLLSMLVCLAVLLPHIIWIFEENLGSVHYGLRKAQAGELSMSSPLNVLVAAASPYTGLMPFFVVFFFFFASFFSFGSRRRGAPADILTRAVLTGLIIPITGVILFRAGHFAERWLAPVMFMIPLSLFLMVNIDENDRRFKLFGFVCAFTAATVLIVRIVIGFMPDMVRKVEHVHFPFRQLSIQVAKKLDQEGIPFQERITIVTDDAFIAANVMAWIPGMRFVHLRKVRKSASEGKNIPSRDVILLWDAEKLGKAIPDKFLDFYPSATGVSFEAPYLHSRKHAPFVLGLAFANPDHK